MENLNENVVFSYPSIFKSTDRYFSAAQTESGTRTDVKPLFAPRQSSQQRLPGGFLSRRIQERSEPLTAGFQVCVKKGVRLRSQEERPERLCIPHREVSRVVLPENADGARDPKACVQRRNALQRELAYGALHTYLHRCSRIRRSRRKSPALLRFRVSPLLLLEEVLSHCLHRKSGILVSLFLFPL